MARQSTADMERSRVALKDALADCIQNWDTLHDMATGLLTRLSAQGYAVIRVHAADPRPEAHQPVAMRHCDKCGNGYFPDPFLAGERCAACNVWPP